jgi:bile acid:Na+ symporter, BASS family
MPKRDRLTIAIELGVKNATLGILVATLLSDNPLYAAPSAVYGLLMYVSAAAGDRLRAPDDAARGPRGRPR